MTGLHSKLLNVISNKGTISSIGSTVHTIWAAVPVLFRTTSSRADSAITILFGGNNLLGSGKFDQLFSGSNKGAISSISSTVHTIWAAVPVLFRATSSGADSTITILLAQCNFHIILNNLLHSQLSKLFLNINKGAVSSIGSTVHTIWAAVPVLLRATSSWADSAITVLLGSNNLLHSCHLDQFFLSSPC